MALPQCHPEELRRAQRRGDRPGAAEIATPPAPSGRGWLALTAPASGCTREEE